MPRPQRCSNEFYDLISTCWSLKADLRPRFSLLKSIIPDVSVQRMPFLQLFCQGWTFWPWRFNITWNIHVIFKIVFMVAECREPSVSSKEVDLELIANDRVIIIHARCVLMNVTALVLHESNLVHWIFAFFVLKNHTVYQNPKIENFSHIIYKRGSGTFICVLSHFNSHRLSKLSMVSISFGLKFKASLIHRKYDQCLSWQLYFPLSAVWFGTGRMWGQGNLDHFFVHQCI